MKLNSRRNMNIMIKCPNCNMELEDDVKFCGNCGQKIEKAVVCQNCGQQNSADYAFCRNCGAPFSNIADVSAKPEKDALPKKPFKLSKKAVTIGSVCIALVLVVVVILSALSGGGVSNYALYLKDNELYYTGISKIEPWQVTACLCEDVNVNSSFASLLGIYIQLCSDGKLFYIDKISGSSDGLSLYYRYVNKPEQEPVKIDSDIISYIASDSGDCVTT